ncbi:MAG TPA: nuclear transport factor 2 family protein [Steroidobacteraceae bacterium]|nr:nuclear transport factor 2 family protein [Steroidobacteraceae bacterium]
MNTSRLVFLAATLLIARLTSADESRTPEQVVRAYAATWNANDPAAFFELQDAGIQKFALDASTSGFKLTTSGLETVRQKYAPLFAKSSRVHVEIVSLTTLGEIVVTRDHVTNAAEGYDANEMTMYQVHDGKIVIIWYLGRESATPALLAVPKDP